MFVRSPTLPQRKRTTLACRDSIAIVQRTIDTCTELIRVSQIACMLGGTTRHLHVGQFASWSDIDRRMQNAIDRNTGLLLMCLGTDQGPAYGQVLRRELDAITRAITYDVPIAIYVPKGTVQVTPYFRRQRARQLVSAVFSADDLDVSNCLKLFPYLTRDRVIFGQLDQKHDEIKGVLKRVMRHS